VRNSDRYRNGQLRNEAGETLSRAKRCRKGIRGVKKSSKKNDRKGAANLAREGANEGGERKVQWEGCKEERQKMMQEGKKAKARGLLREGLLKAERKDLKTIQEGRRGKEQTDWKRK